MEKLSKITCHRNIGRTISEQGGVWHPCAVWGDFGAVIVQLTILLATERRLSLLWNCPGYEVQYWEYNPSIWSSVLKNLGFNGPISTILKCSTDGTDGWRSRSMSTLRTWIRKADAAESEQSHPETLPQTVSCRHQCCMRCREYRWPVKVYRHTPVALTAVCLAAFGCRIALPFFTLFRSQ